MTSTDIDSGYKCEEHPAEFRSRFQVLAEVAGQMVRVKLTPEERQTIGDITVPEDAFKKLYPGYVSLDEWREQQMAKLAEEKSKAVSAEMTGDSAQ